MLLLPRMQARVGDGQEDLDGHAAGVLELLIAAGYRPSVFTQVCLM